MRKIPLIPLCHNGLSVNDLPIPFRLLQGICLTDAKDLDRLYRRVAAVLGCKSPNVDFEHLSRKLEINRLPRFRMVLNTGGETLDHNNRMSAPAQLYSRGKVPNPAVVLIPEEKDGDTDGKNPIHFPVHFIRARITNQASCALNSHIPYLTAIEGPDIDRQNVRQQLRPSDSWYFEPDHARRALNVRGGYRFVELAPKRFCHCDIWF
jgi:hypothetical protein